MSDLITQTMFTGHSALCVDKESRVLSYLKNLEGLGLIQSIDYHFACFIYSELTEKKPNLIEANVNLVTLCSAKLSNELLAQHTCLDLTSFNPLHAFGLPLDKGVLLPEKEIWINTLIDSGLCHQHSLTTDAQTTNVQTIKVTPFVIMGNLLYMQRYYAYENNLADFIKQEPPFMSWYKHLTPDMVEQTLAPLFDKQANKQPDWQKLAVVNSISRRFSVITGGPGTGKTTTVVKLLAAMQTLKQIQSEQKQSLNIQLVAPTGKAAQRLSESICGSKNALNVSNEIKALIPEHASTIHRMLKPRGLTDFVYNRHNPLFVDVLILDEASMVDSGLMSKLVTALPKHCQLILLGDKEQLASVEAGNVLAEICQIQHNDFMVELKKSYRFDDMSEIGRLAAAIKQGNARDALEVLTANLHSAQNITWLRAEQRQLATLIEQGVNHYLSIRKLTYQGDELSWVKQIFCQLQSFQILCCVKAGEQGVEGINLQIERRISSRLRTSIYKHHYEYRPIMISENAYHLDLYNGDIGIELIDPENNQLTAYFLRGKSEIKKVYSQRLPKHDTVYAMTVHKSQGSEFEHALLVLPDNMTRLVSREIIYTGLTRAKSTFTLYGSELGIIKGVEQITQRNSGLALLLNK